MENKKIISVGMVLLALVVVGTVSAGFLGFGEEKEIGDNYNIDLNYEIHYTGEYKVLSKTGDEALLDVSFEEVEVETDEVLMNNEKRIRKDTRICLEADFVSKQIEEVKGVKGDDEVLVATHDYNVPSKLEFYKSFELEEQDDLDRELVKDEVNKESKFEEGDKYVFCYQANPEEDYYLKFGENSIIVVQDYTIFSDSYFEDARGEVNYSHVEISESAPYDSLVGYWNFDGEVQNTEGFAAYDLSNNDNDGVGVENAVIGSSGCIYDDCLDGDGSGDWVSVPHSNSLNINSGESFVIGGWFKPDVNGGNYALGKRTATTGFTIYFRTYGDDYTIRTYLQGGGVCGYVGDVHYTGGNWYHVMAVYNASSQNLTKYVNGTKIDEYDCSGISNFETSENLLIGQSLSTGVSFSGLVDEVMVFSTALSSTDISEIYQNSSARFKNSGNQTTKQFQIESGYNTVDVVLEDYEENMGSNIKARIGYWDVSSGYDSSDADLIGYWHLDEASWNGTSDEVVDSSGEGNHGEAVEGADTTDVSVFHRAGDFDGSWDYVNITDGGEFDFTTDFTISAWVNTVSGGGAVFSNSYEEIGAAHSGYRLGAGGDVAFSAGEGGPVGYQIGYAGQSVNDGEWHHVLVDYDYSAKNVSFYIDGNFVNSANFTDQIQYGTSKTTMGVCITDMDPVYEFDGSIDEVMVFNRSLTADEIKQLYVKGRANWDYSSQEDYEDGVTFTIADTSTNLLPQYQLEAGTDDFYTPLLKTSQNFSTYNITDACEAPLVGNWIWNFVLGCEFEDDEVEVDGGVFSMGSGEISFSNYNITASGIDLNSTGAWNVTVSQGFVLQDG